MSLSKVSDPISALFVSEKTFNLILHGISGTFYAFQNKIIEIGAIAGGSSTLLIYPFHTLVTKLQSKSKINLYYRIYRTRLNHKDEKEKKKILLEIIRKEVPSHIYSLF